jgi:hypothetical protein
MAPRFLATAGGARGMVPLSWVLCTAGELAKAKVKVGANCLWSPWGQLRPLAVPGRSRCNITVTAIHPVVAATAHRPSRAAGFSCLRVIGFLPNNLTSGVAIFVNQRLCWRLQPTILLSSERGAPMVGITF